MKAEATIVKTLGGRPLGGMLVTAVLVLLAVLAASLAFGAKEVTLRELWLAMSTSAGGGDTVTLIRDIRLPRIAAALLVGAALSVSGAIMQGVTRNPLADPGLLGVTSGANAALACTLAVLPSIGYMGIFAACFAGAAAGALLAFGLGAATGSGLSSMHLVLSGAAVSALLSAIAEGVALHFKLSKDVSMWTSGGLIGASWEQIRMTAPVILAALAVALLLSRPLTLLSLNEEASVGLGVRTIKVKAALYGLAVVLTGAAVALAGNLAFLGLMIPHIVRRFAGNDYRIVVPLSAVGGAALMLLADLLGRTLNLPYEVPVAAIVAMMGLPFFLLIVRKGARPL